MAINDILDSVYCPLVDDNIQDIDCIENRDCVDGFIKLSSMPDKYKVKDNYISICKKCEYHDY